MRNSSFSNPVHLAIVSPCSTCKNQLSVGQDQKPACPRRAIQQQIENNQNDGLDTTQIDHLGLFGTEGSEQEGNGALRNPVYSNDMNAILVWIALLADNAGVRDGQGNLVTPNILAPGFDTSYIQCHPLPVTPSDNEAVYFQKGGFAEGDQVQVTMSARQQMAVDGSEVPVLIDGFAQKVNFVFNHPRTALSKDLVPAGT